MAISRRNFLKTTLAAGAALSATMLDPLPAAAKAVKPKKRFRAKRVLIMTFDGIRVDALAQARTPNIDALIREGSASYTTRDVMPSVTLPNYTSHLCGAGPEVHGVADNRWLVDNYKLAAIERDAEGYFPSSFQVLKDQVPGIRTAFYWNWKPLIRPYNPKVFDDKLNVGNDDYSQLYDRAMQFISDHRDEPQFVFLYTVHTDHAGHEFAWMSPEYIKSIEDGDVQVGRMIEFLKAEGLYEDTHIFFITDHGGINKGHGGVSPEEMIVPWVVRGPGIKKGFTITEANNTVNTASTVVRLFGATQPLCWTGEVPESIFL